MLFIIQMQCWHIITQFTPFKEILKFDLNKHITSFVR